MVRVKSLFLPQPVEASEGGESGPLPQFGEGVGEFHVELCECCRVFLVLVVCGFLDVVGRVGSQDSLCLGSQLVIDVDQGAGDRLCLFQGDFHLRVLTSFDSNARGDRGVLHIAARSEMTGHRTVIVCVVVTLTIAALSELLPSLLVHRKQIPTTVTHEYRGNKSSYISNLINSGSVPY